MYSDFIICIYDIVIVRNITTIQDILFFIIKASCEDPCYSLYQISKPSISGWWKGSQSNYRQLFCITKSYCKTITDIIFWRKICVFDQPGISCTKTKDLISLKWTKFVLKRFEIIEILYYSRKCYYVFSHILCLFSHNSMGMCFKTFGIIYAFDVEFSMV